MKSTGIIRRVDELGRVVIPIELRNQFGILEKTLSKYMLMDLQLYWKNMFLIVFFAGLIKI